MRTAHTKGPWEYRPDRTIQADGLPLARCYADRNEAANGPLMAEAPAMLAALREIDQLLKDWPTMRALSAYGAEVATNNKRQARLVIGAILARIDGEA